MTILLEHNLAWQMMDAGGRGGKSGQKICTLRGFKVPLCILITKLSSYQAQCRYWYLVQPPLAGCKNYTGRRSNPSSSILVGKCFWLVGFNFLFFQFFRCLCTFFLSFFLSFYPVPTIDVVVPLSYYESYTTLFLGNLEV